MAYTPDPKFYKKQIDEQKKLLKKFSEASYSSDRNGYVIDGKVYSEAQRVKSVSSVESAISKLEDEEKTYGKYGPNYGDKAQSNEAGIKFQELYAATQEPVNTFDDAVANIQAWKTLDAFVKQNKDIRIVESRSAVLEKNGRSVNGSINVRFDPTKDAGYKTALERGLTDSTSQAKSLAEEGVVESRTVKKGKGAAATRSTQRVVLDNETLQKRLAIVNNAVSGKAVTAGPTGPGFRATEGFAPGVTGPTGATGPTVGKGATGPTVSKVSPVAPVTSATPPTGKSGKTPAAATVVVDGKKVKVGGDKWKEIIQEEFGSLWDIYNDNADVKKVVDKSVAEGWYNDTVKLDASLKNTNWYRATQSSVRAYTIQKSSDPATLEASINQAVADLRAESLASGVTLSDATLNSLAENKVKYKWSDQQVANAIGSETVATARLGGPQAVADLRKGSVGTELREIADNYAQKPTDTMLDMWVAEVMQGTKTTTQFTDLMKTQASTQYRSLAPLIEKGQDVKTAVSMYTNAAQNVLGVDPNTVDWSQDKWNKALNYQDPKTSEYRQMDSWEWNRYLRSLPEWQETDDAKRTYRSAAFTLAQAFGKTS